MNNYLLLYIRKSNLPANYMGDFINDLLHYLVNSSRGDHSKFYLRGGCWSKNVNTATQLIDILFQNISTDLEVYLSNSYPGYSTTNTYTALINRGYLNTYEFDLYKDHAKELLLTKGDEVVFYMCGSSNVSKQTYITSDRNIDQTDILFINMNKFSKSYIDDLVANVDDELLQYWYNKLNNDEVGKVSKSNSHKEHFTKYYEGNTISVSVCYNNKDSILDKIKNGIQENLNKNSNR